MVDASRFVAGQLVVVVVEHVLGVYLLGESLVFLVPFLVHSQNISLGGGKNTCHVCPPRSSSRCALAFVLVVFAEATPLVPFLHCEAGVAPLDLAKD